MKGAIFCAEINDLKGLEIQIVVLNEFLVLLQKGCVFNLFFVFLFMREYKFCPGRLSPRSVIFIELRPVSTKRGHFLTISSNYINLIMIKLTDFLCSSFKISGIKIIRVITIQEYRFFSHNKTMIHLFLSFHINYVLCRISL